MTRIARVIAAPALGASYVEDLAALRMRRIPSDDRVAAAPVTPGFRRVAEPAEAVSVGIFLEGFPQPVWGDCVGAAFGGQAGGGPVFRAAEGLAAIRQAIGPALEGRPVESFRALAETVDALVDGVDFGALRPEPDAPAVARLTRRDVVTSPASLLRAVRQELDRALAPEESAAAGQLPLASTHAALCYGLSQALLGAAALARGVPMAQVIAEEWGLPLPDAPAPIHAQIGHEWRANADRLIVRGVASLPHLLIDDIEAQLGRDGSKLAAYVRWLSQRIGELGSPSYHPTIHLDVRGALGTICRHEPGRVLGHLYGLEMAAKPYPLRVESPLILDSREVQIAGLKTLREYVATRGWQVHIVADEWANTLDDIRAFVQAGAADMIHLKMPDLGGLHHSVEAVLTCRAAGVGACLGGSCAETDLSARVAVHVALAVRPDVFMARPGLGVDEAVSLTHNEMARTLAVLAG